MKNISIHNKQAGAVSIFVVIFATLLMSIITVGFIRLMISEQQKSANNDLSQSAYDSALTGVEDAKRAILRYQNACSIGAANCATLASQLQSNVCNAGVRTLADVGTGLEEVMIQQSESDRALDQAYTCVTVKLDSPNYTGTIDQNGSVLVPLSGTGAFNEVTVEWYSDKDAGGSSIDLPATADGRSMLNMSDWPIDRPSLLRTSLMQFGSDFTLGEFDTTKPGQSNANTVFLYPQRSGNPTNELIGLDPRYTDPATAGDLTRLDDKSLPTATGCNSVLGGANGPYACKMKLVLPDPIDAGTRTAYLRLTSLYNGTQFRLSLSHNGAPLNFSNVQAVVDSTGRANDLFRRVESRVDLVDTSFPYPEAALDLGGNLCKSFSVNEEAYANIGTACNP